MPQIKDGQGLDVSVPQGQSIAIATVTGTYSATVISGTSAGTVLATASDAGGTFGPYASGATVRLSAGLNSCVSYEVGAAPVVGDAPTAKYSLDPTTGAVTGLVGPDGSTYPVITNSTFANLATAFPASSNSGRICRITDMNNALFESNGTRWKPINSVALIGSLDTETSMTGTTETIVFQKSIPAGAIRNGDRMRIYYTGSKSGTSETATYTLRFGPAGTIADPVIQTFSALVTTQISTGVLQIFKRLSATTIRKLGSGNSATSFAAGGITAAIAVPVNVSNMDSNQMFLSLTMTSSAGSETINVNDFTLELLSASA